jgi:hypothetical protein
MRKFVLAAALFASLCTVATAGPKEDGLQVLEKWTNAFSVPFAVPSALCASAAAEVRR